jgi:hypothetical protein
MSIRRAKGDGMVRLLICLLLALAVSLPGCRTPPPAPGPEAADVHRADFLEKAASVTHSAAWQWSDDHPVAICTGAVLLVVVGAVVLTGLAVTAVFGYLR